MSITKTMLTGGNFQDAMGNLLANGYLTMKLSQDSQVNDSQVCSGVEINIVLDGNGDVAAYPTIPADQFVWANDVLSPVNSFYTVSGYTAEGQPAFGPNNQQVVSGGIGGGTFDTGTWIPNQVVSWAPALQTPQVFVNGTALSSTQEIDFIDSATIDFVDEGNGEISASARAGIPLSFSAVTTGTNTSATMTVGSGATLTFSGPGVLNANKLYGVAISNTAPTTGQILTATSATTATWSTGGSSGGGIYPTLTPPVSTNFTWNNPNSWPETTTDYPTKMLVVLPTIATGLWLVQNAALPAPPYTVDIGTMYFASNNINVVSILLSNSGLTDARTFGSRVDSDAAGEYGEWNIVDQSWSGPTAPGAEIVIYTADGMSASQHIVFTRVTNDGTNLSIYWSANGENYILLETIAVIGLGFTPASTGIAFYNTSHPMNVWCYHWAVSGSILPQNS